MQFETQLDSTIILAKKPAIPTMRLHKLQKKAEEFYTPKVTTVRSVGNLVPSNLGFYS